MRRLGEEKSDRNRHGSDQAEKVSVCNQDRDCSEHA
jgi:hypothetical protein